MAEPTIPPCRSLDDILAWKEQEEGRYEFLPGGVVTMMAGGIGDRDAIATKK
jgi:hypothetical protein